MVHFTSGEAPLLAGVTFLAPIEVVEILLRCNVLADFVIDRVLGQFFDGRVPRKNNITIDDLFGHIVVGHGALSVSNLFAWLIHVVEIEN